MFCLSFSGLLQALGVAIISRLAVAELIPFQDACKAAGDGLDAAYTTFNSSITSDGPLMWTVSAGTLQNHEDKTFRYYERNFVLSTTPSLNLTDVTSFSGFGFFFYNVTTALQSPKSASLESFNCDAVMSAQCQADLLQQVLDDYESLFNVTEPDFTNYFTCDNMGKRFESRDIPPGCKYGISQPTWGYTRGAFTAGRDLTERLSYPSGRLCGVSNDTAHNDQIVMSDYAILPANGEESKAFRNGTTPVVTMFFAFADSEQGVAHLPQPELHLTCMKTIPTVEEQTKINRSPGHMELLPPALITSVLIFSEFFYALG